MTQAHLLDDNNVVAAIVFLHGLADKELQVGLVFCNQQSTSKLKSCQDFLEALGWLERGSRGRQAQQENWMGRPQAVVLSTDLERH